MTITITTSNVNGIRAAYLDPVSGAMLTGWQLINGKWYYFSKTSGAVPLGSMYRETRTPDGYYVDKDGAWDGLEAKEN